MLRSIILIFGVVLSHCVALAQSNIILAEERKMNKDTTIYINNQPAFDNLQTIIEKALSFGYTEIEVRLEGSFVFKDKHIVFNHQDLNASIHFIGKECNLTPMGRQLVAKHDGNNLNYAYSYITNTREDVDIWTPFYATDSLIQIVNENEKLCRVHIPPTCNINISTTPGTYIQYTEWYYTRTCRIDSINDGYIYFKVPELYLRSNTYNVNYDYYWQKRLPRFRLLKSLNSIAQPNNAIREGDAGTFVSVENSKFKKLSFENINIYGNKSWANIFNITNTSFHDYFLLYDCIFYGQRGGVLASNNSCNIFVEKCQFYNQHSTIILSDNNTARTVINNNIFENCGLGMMNSFCVRCNGQDYLVKGNKFINYGYGAIAVGVWYKTNNPKPCRGIVEQNIIYNTEDYIKNIDQHGLMDGGAIYLWTLNDGAVIRYNFINNISGAGYNRGIYCDDGAMNFALYGNIILNVHNSNCIDARYSGVLEDFNKSKSSNINKVVEYNIVNGGVKLQGKPKFKNGCVKGINYITEKVVTGNVRNYNDLEEKKEDIIINIRKVRNTKVIVDRKSRRLLRSTPIYDEIKRYITIW